MKQAGRPTGKRVRQVLAMCEKLGGATTTQLQKQIPEISGANMAKYCRRAESYGFMTVVGKLPMHCTVVEGWRARIDVRKEVPAAPSNVLHAMRTQPSSVWDLARL